MALKIHETPAVMSKRKRRLVVPREAVCEMVLDWVRSQGVEMTDACVVLIFAQSNCNYCGGAQMAGIEVRIEGD